MKAVLIFAGTSEGRELTGLLSTLPVKCAACVATPYGEAGLEPYKNVAVLRERMDAARMERVIRERGVDLVIDATHPYAEAASGNIRIACEALGVERLRLLREKSPADGGCEYYEDTESLVRRLNRLPGNILLTTGSKDLPAFACVAGYRERIYPRILPFAPSLEACLALGFDPARVISAQGPFSQAFNEALMREFDIRILVTKDSGRAGGFEQKLAAARALDVQVLILRRPGEDEGLTLAQMKQLLLERYGKGGGKRGE